MARAAKPIPEGFHTITLDVPEGETCKSLRQAEKLYDRLIENHCGRETPLIALGGGPVVSLLWPHTKNSPSLMLARLPVIVTRLSLLVLREVVWVKAELVSIPIPATLW